MRISVVLPVYNAAATISAAVKSVLNQTEKDFALLIVDDGSTDETPSILEELSKTDPRIRVITISHSGVTAAFNTGIQHATGEYIARMDADDEMFPTKLEKQAKFLDENPDVGLVSCLVAHGGNADEQQGYRLHIDWLNTLITHEEISLNRFVESPVCNPSVMFRSGLVEKYGGAREGDFPEDYEMWLRWLDAGVRVEKIPEVLLKWNDLPSRLTRNDARYSDEAFNRAKTIYLAKFLRNKIGERKIWLCGAGRATRRKSDLLLAENLPVGGYIDVDPKKSGTSYNGLPVVSPAKVPSKENAFVLSYVTNRGAREEIRRWLKGLAFVEGEDFLMVG